jgi:hypothetical protein
MTEAVSTLLIAVAVVGLIVLFVRRRKKKNWNNSPETRIWKAYHEGRKVATLNGHTVHYEDGLGPQDTISLGVDAGADRCFTKFECGYSNVDRSRHRIHVVVLRSEPDSRGNPCFRVPVGPGDPYYDSLWDKMRGQGGQQHYILAAGQTVAAGEPYGDVVGIGHGDEAWTAQITEYELEHAFLAWYDGPKYEETKAHLNGAGHPLVQDCPGERRAAFASRGGIACGGAAGKP